MKVYVVANLKSAVYRTKYQDIDIVKGSVKITEQKTPWRLKEALGYLKKDYDVCLIDTRPVFDMLTMNALYAADVFLTPVKFDNFCRDNLTMVEDAYHEILENNPDLEWKIFANMVSNTKAQKLSSRDKKRRAASTQNNQMDTLLKIKRKCRTVLSGT